MREVKEDIGTFSITYNSYSAFWVYIKDHDYELQLLAADVMIKSVNREGYSEEQLLAHGRAGAIEFLTHIFIPIQELSNGRAGEG